MKTAKALHREGHDALKKHPDDAPDTGEIEVRTMQHEQTFDVLLILRAEGHGLVASASISNGQPCDRQIHVDTAGVVREQHQSGRQTQAEERQSEDSAYGRLRAARTPAMQEPLTAARRMR